MVDRKKQERLAYRKEKQRNEIKDQGRLVLNKLPGVKVKTLIEIYNVSINQDIIDLLEDSDEEFDMYFKAPNQLEDIFQVIILKL